MYSHSTVMATLNLGSFPTLRTPVECSVPGKEQRNYAFCGQVTAKRNKWASDLRKSSVLFLNCIAHKSLLSHPAMVWRELRNRESPEMSHKWFPPNEGKHQEWGVTIPPLKCYFTHHFIHEQKYQFPNYITL